MKQNSQQVMHQAAKELYQLSGIMQVAFRGHTGEVRRQSSEAVDRVMAVADRLLEHSAPTWTALKPLSTVAAPINVDNGRTRADKKKPKPKLKQVHRTKGKPIKVKEFWRKDGSYSPAHTRAARKVLVAASAP